MSLSRLTTAKSTSSSRSSGPDPLLFYCNLTATNYRTYVLYGIFSNQKPPNMGAMVLRTTRYRWARLDSNQRPSDYESPALTAELRARKYKVLWYHVSRSDTGTHDTRALFVQSGRRDSNPRILAWKANALPLGDARIEPLFYREGRRWSSNFFQPVQPVIYSRPMTTVSKFLVAIPFPTTTQYYYL